MKLLTHKKPRNSRIISLSGTEIKLTFISLLVFTFQSSIASTVNTSYKNHTSILVEKKVTGTITDKDGMPLPGVNIIVKGTTKGVQTDMDGNFTIIVNDTDNKLIIT